MRTVHTEDNAQGPKLLKIKRKRTKTTNYAGHCEWRRNEVTRIRVWQYAEDIDKLAHTLDTCSSWLCLTWRSPPLQLRWFGDYHCRPKVLIKLVQWTISIAGSTYAAELKSKIQGSQPKDIQGVENTVHHGGRGQYFRVRGTRTGPQTSHEVTTPSKKNTSRRSVTQMMEPIAQGRHQWLLSLTWQNKAQKQNKTVQEELWDIRGDRMGLSCKRVKSWRVRRQYCSTVGSNHISALRNGVDMTPDTHLGRITFQLEWCWKLVRDAAPTPLLCSSILSTVKAPIVTFFGNEPSRSRTERVVPKNKSSSASRSRSGGDRGTYLVLCFHPAEVSSNLGRVAIFSDAIGDGWCLRSHGIWSTPGADQFWVGTISFSVWAVD